MKKYIQTVCYPVAGDQILLGQKKKGMGIGRWNGFGGNLKTNENIKKCAERELWEESGLTALKIKKCGVTLNIYNDKVIELHFFLIEKFQGEPKSTDEMDPLWFSQKHLPKQMWPSDKYLLPHFLAGENRYASFYLQDNGDIRIYKFFKNDVPLKQLNLKLKIVA